VNGATDIMKPAWRVPEESRPWPSVDAIRLCLGASLGLDLDKPRMESHGGRTISLAGGEGQGQFRLAVVRQRCADPRVVCPLEEEYEALQSLNAANPGLVPKPLGVIEPDGSEKLLVLSWVEGSRLGSPRVLQSDVHRVASTLADALSAFHCAGRHLALDRFSRALSIDRILQRAERSPLRDTLFAGAAWDRALDAAMALAEDLGTSTLLHGDPHAYNLIETADSPCWLDFERLSVGPPQFDHARAWVLLQAQAETAVPTPWDRDSEGAIVCRFLTAASFLEDGAPTWPYAARRAVEWALTSVVQELQ
jgi:hypothetical protein